MEEQAWTARGAVTEADKVVISTIAEHHPVAGRIFMTGEVHGGYVGLLGAKVLANMNGTLDGSLEISARESARVEEPLFIQTKQGTIQMARFEPETVWRLLHPDMLKRLQMEEEERLGMEVQLDEFDFYQSLILTVKALHGPHIFPVAGEYDGPDVFYNIMYLGALLLYGKPGYMAVPVSQHFALPENAAFFKEVKYRQLNKVERKTALDLREKHKAVRGLTNPELNFLVSLYDADAKAGGQ